MWLALPLVAAHFAIMPLRSPRLVPSRVAIALGPTAEDAPIEDVPDVSAEDLIEENVLNEEKTVTVTYTGGATGRTRRVRRATRPPIEERWAQQTADALEEPGYRRMSAFCNFGALNLEAAAELLAADDRFRAFGDRLSVVSYADVVHCRFMKLGDQELRDAFLFPCAPPNMAHLLIWHTS